MPDAVTENDKENSLYWPFLIQIVVGHHRNIDIVHLYTVYIKKNDPILLSLQYINERMQDVDMKNDTGIVKSNWGCWEREKEKKNMKWPLYDCCTSMARVAVCGSAKHTVANRTVKWKERPVYHKHTNICPWKSEPTFQCTRRFFLKRIKTHLLIYHSQRTQLSSWQVSLTCFTHLKQPVCKLRLWMSQDVLRMHTITHLTS